MFRASCLLAPVFIGVGFPSASAQSTELVTVDRAGGGANGDSWGPAITPDGRFVAFASDARDLVKGDQNGMTDVFLRDRLIGTTTRVSVDSAGQEADGRSYEPDISVDGRYIVFTSNAGNLVADDTNLWSDVFLHDRATGTTERVSVSTLGAQGSEGSFMPSICADGNAIAFVSQAADLVADDANFSWDVFVHTRGTGTTERVSVNSAGVEGDSGSLQPSLSADGRRVAFTSLAQNLVPGDTNFADDIFLHDRATGATQRVSLGGAANEADGFSQRPALSADGLQVAFESVAQNLVAQDTNHAMDIFVRDLGRAVTTRVSVDSAGGEANGPSRRAALAPDGRAVAFVSSASNLVGADGNGRDDVFFHDQILAFTGRASVAGDGTEADGASDEPAVTADGRGIAFSSVATNLVAGDANGHRDLFLRTRLFVPASAATYGDGLAGTWFEPALTVDGTPRINQSVTLRLTNSYVQPTLALLLSGPAKASIPTNRGGTLLVQILGVQLLALDPAGWSCPCFVPPDESLCGLELDLQALEGDPGAPQYVSFTKGLELICGY